MVIQQVKPVGFVMEQGQFTNIYKFEKSKILLISTQGKLNDSAIYTTGVVKGISENNEKLNPK